jgi:hypothetical protein
MIFFQPSQRFYKKFHVSTMNRALKYKDRIPGKVNFA